MMSNATLIYVHYEDGEMLTQGVSQAATFCLRDVPCVNVTRDRDDICFDT